MNSDKQELIDECNYEIAHLERHIADCRRSNAPVFRAARMLQAQQIALSSLTAAPVWGQARFKGGDWSSCTAEHAAMVMENPEEWGDYECRYLYTTPPASIPAPDGWVNYSERMPENGEDVIVHTPRGIIDKAMYLDGKFYGYMFVTHWMPLPAVPGGS